MNSKKILNSLIIIFIFMNIAFFILNIFYYKDMNRISSDRVKTLKEVLKKHNISLNADLPEHNKMKVIYFSKPKDREEILVEKLFDDRKSSYIEGVHKHSNDNETLVFNKITEEGRFFYSANEPSYKKEDKNLLNKFLSDFKVDNENYKLFSEIKRDGATLYFFNEQYEEFTIFSNEIVVKIDENGIKEATGIRYTPIKFDDNIKELIPIDEALYRLVFEINFKENLNINDISVGYYVNLEQVGNGYRFPVYPYYQIIMDNGVKYYINAFNGQIIS